MVDNTNRTHKGKPNQEELQQKNSQQDFCYITKYLTLFVLCYRENSEKKETLEKLKTELEAKAASLIKEEKELRDKQRRLAREQDSFKREMKKEKEEVCRKWQELKDEITRMEETHEIQKVLVMVYC